MSLSFPDGYLTAYADGSLPYVRASDLNAMQLEDIRVWRAMRGEDLWLHDEFVGDRLSPIWKVPGGLLSGYLLLDDAASGGDGVIKLDPSGNGNDFLETQPFKLDLKDFRCSWRMRFPNIDTKDNGFVRFGIRDASGGGVREQFFECGISQTNFRVAIGNAALSSVGIAYATKKLVYGFFELRRVRSVTNPNNCVVTALIDGAQVATATYPISIASLPLARFSIQCSRSSLADEGEVYVDHAKLWVPRSSISLTKANAQQGAHVESKTATFNGTQDFVDVVWDVAFANANYIVSTGVYNSANTDVISAFVTTKTTTGCRVYCSARFTGEVYVDAHD